MTRPRYRADPPGLRQTVALDDGMTLIFHRPSATTHVVAAPVPEILEAMGEGPASAGEVLKRLAVSYELDTPLPVPRRRPGPSRDRSDPGPRPSPGNAEEDLATHLHELVEAGLLTRI